MRPPLCINGLSRPLKTGHFLIVLRPLAPKARSASPARAKLPGSGTVNRPP